MPGTSVAEAMAVIAGELDLPHVPELPARGAGADLVGRTGVLLAGVATDFGVETVPTGWRRTGKVSRDLRRARSWLTEDLDRVEEVLGDSPGTVKTQICGPWTWAAAVEGPDGRRLLRDPGFVADLAGAWREAAREHLAELSRRLPLRAPVLQVDEPMLPAVLAGDIATSSGLGRLAAVPVADAAALLRTGTAELGAPVVLHCCGAFPFEVARQAGVAGISWDCSSDVPESAVFAAADAVAESVESGQHLIAGAVPAVGSPAADEAWRRLTELWRRTGMAPAGLAGVTVSPGCGLAGSAPGQARARLAVVREVARRASAGEW